jgi:uncharacterized protein with ParB-like and HNH nuclease domain/predicted transport protein
MKATETKFLEFLNGKKQLIIPIYQRTYSWTDIQCKQLWKDIIGATDENVKGHFIGSIVYIERGIFQITSIPQLLVIDGQQRLTTLTLLLAALGKAIEQNPNQIDVTQEEINDDYLFNKHGKDDSHYKLLLTQSDKDTLIRLLEGKEQQEPVSKRIIENYKFFEDQIIKSGIDLMTLYNGISKLILVDISLDREHDNPQLIFESLNSTGLELSQADLIRNYVLMGLEPEEQKELYNDFWFPMEQAFGHSDYVARFDRFMRDYLTVKTGHIPNIREVYEAFKGYSRDKNDSIRELLSDIYIFSKYFVNMALLKEEDKELKQIFTDINTLRVDVAYPLLLELYDDYQNEKLNRDEFVGILKLVENYVFRRAICGINTNSLNKTFATLSQGLNKSHYLESFNAALLMKDSYRRFPNDDEFVRELVVKDLYSFRNRNYWLRKLENYDRKERVNVEDFTIEHIMPQNENLSLEWQQDLGSDWKEIQKEYLHTLGNLTLTGYNSELSDRPFIEKRDMKGGFAYSPLRINRCLAKKDHWNKEEIKNRAYELAELALKVWKGPYLPSDILEKYQSKEKGSDKEIYTIETMEGHEYLQGRRDLFEQLRKRILNLDASVKEEYKKYYVAFKANTNFVDIIPQKSRLLLSLNIKPYEINDPKELCRDVTNLGRWGNGYMEVGISSFDQLEDIMVLVNQSFEKHVENGDD